MDLSVWRPLQHDLLEYEQPIDHEAFFNKLVLIWRTQVHTINRRIAGSKLINEDAQEFTDVVNSLPIEILQLVESRQTPFEIRKLIPKEKNGSWFCFEISFIDYSCPDEIAALFVPVQLDIDKGTFHTHVSFPYSFGIKILDEKRIQFSLAVPSAISETDAKWLRIKAYPTLRRWIQRLDPSMEIKPTNRLLNVESYQQRYTMMKNNYGYDLCKRWTEKTNPQKYVFEDCGIASYLLETWERLKFKPSCFADLGCGNGLLVHLLNNEEVNGVGFDIRERKLWKTMLSGTDLREFVVDPTVPKILPVNCDYLIGNHSDELTPWIPIMAARMRCDFFLLPCCPFDLHGKYHARPGKLGSTYAGFLEYVRYVCKKLGYIIEEDRLSIPSSKRLCIIGKTPPDGLPSPDTIEKIIQELVAERASAEAKPFIARPKRQEVRNCANIPRDVVDQLSMRVFKELLKADPSKSINGWRTGGPALISEMIKILTPEEKALMKKQDGGFQTFLKNQHQIYEGKVHIRNFYETKKKTTVNSSVKCWMLAHHPDGCLYGSSCKFIH